MRIFRMALVGGFAGAFMAGNVGDTPCGSIADQRGNYHVNGCRQFDPSTLGRLARRMGPQRFRRLGSGRVGWRRNRWRDRERRLRLLWRTGIRLWRTAVLRRLLPRLQLLSGIRWPLLLRLLAGNPGTGGLPLPTLWALGLLVRGGL